MKVTLWGTRGSLPAPGPDTARYGGNTSCVQVTGSDGTTLVLDAGSGIRRLGASLFQSPRRIDLLLTHLHMDHLQGLGFFAPLFVPGREIHIWGPASTTLTLWGRLARYLSPPLFPVRLRDVPARITVHEVPCGRVAIGCFTVDTALVCHPGPTVGYRIEGDGKSLTYIPDHEPALGVRGPLPRGGWTSGHGLAQDADLLIHDGQYDEPQYGQRAGWGHSTVGRALEFASMTDARKLVLFHHDPEHDDATLDRMYADVLTTGPTMPVVCGAEGMAFEL